jgi:hypothetical protein
MKIPSGGIFVFCCLQSNLSLYAGIQAWPKTGKIVVCQHTSWPVTVIQHFRNKNNFVYEHTSLALRDIFVCMLAYTWALKRILNI